jgi:hypothetical protein
LFIGNPHFVQFIGRKVTLERQGQNGNGDENDEEEKAGEHGWLRVLSFAILNVEATKIPPPPGESSLSNWIGRFVQRPEGCKTFGTF